MSQCGCMDCLTSDTCMSVTVEELRERLAGMQEALEWYAEGQSPLTMATKDTDDPLVKSNQYCLVIGERTGKRAREALAKFASHDDSPTQRQQEG